MKRLVFDTSTPTVVVGIKTPAEWIGSIEKAEAQSQSKQLFSVIQEVLDYHQIRKDEIKEIAVGIGPGSYTGLRIAITVAKVWAYAGNIKLYQFSSGDLFDRTKAQKADAEHPHLELLEEADFQLVTDVNKLEPIYTNDHFA